MYILYILYITSTRLGPASYLSYSYSFHRHTMMPQVATRATTVLMLLMVVTGWGSAAASDTFESIKGRVKLPKTARPPTMRVVLNDGSGSEELTTFTRVDGSFEVCIFCLGIYLFI